MKIIGIDLGTTNSVIYEYKKGTAHPIKLEGNEVIPSVVYIDGGNVAVGTKAKRWMLITPEQTLSSMKRHMGTDYQVMIEGKGYTPVDAAYYVLDYIKRETEKELCEPINDVVITVPAYFNDDQRKDTKTAAEKAGLNVLRLLPEPTAAAIAYGLDKEKDQTIMVFDLGGGTFDVSILEVLNNDFNVKGVDGNSQLGGDDFDNAIVEHLNQWIEDNSGQNVRGNKIAQQKLKAKAEEVKIELTQVKSTEIHIPNVVEGVNIEIDRFTRKEFSTLIEPYQKEIVEKTNSVIGNAGLTVDDINRVVLVGGSSKIPIIQQTVTSNFKQPYLADNMDTYVAQGAALVCASLVSPKELPAEEKALPIDLNFKDVIPHTLGVALLHEGVLTVIPILKKNIHYPAKAATLALRKDKWQTAIRISVYRGESSKPGDNTRLGDLEMDITPQYVGKDPEVLFGCIFELDNDGLLTFTTVEMPQIPDNYAEIAMLDSECFRNEGIVSYDTIESIIKKKNFKQEKITLKT